MKRDCINPKPNWCASLALGAWFRRRWNATSRCRSWAKRKATYRQIDEDRVETERRMASLQEQVKSFPSRSVTLKRWADNPEALER